MPRLIVRIPSTNARVRDAQAQGAVGEISNMWKSSFRKPRSGYPESRIFNGLLDSWFCWSLPRTPIRGQPRNDDFGLVQGFLGVLQNLALRS